MTTSVSPTKPYLLLTGATGLLGRYLLRDLTLAGVSLAVVVRRTRWESAQQRIETAMARWENELGRALLRPVVLEGDISQPQLDLSDAALAWLAGNCGTVVHSAASLTFYADDQDGEPFRSNVQGTRNVIELCRQAGVRHYHHVSTAYVCGQRRGRILESELDLGQEPSNDYEQTKIAAEKEVLAADAFDQVTVYRPSIIVGDSDTGFTTSYHGFYTPLRLLHAIPWQALMAGDFFRPLAINGDERKNLVPVNWVSAAMTQLITRPECHGRTYHLTNPTPTTTAGMRDAFVTKLAQQVTSQPQKPVVMPASTAELETSFREQMKVYRSYWSDDPEFDSTQTQQALPHLPCPEITADVMLRLIGFAIDTNFGWPREPSLVPPLEIGSHLATWLANPSPAAATPGARFVSLQVSGRGGGQWHLVVDQGRLVGAGLGVRQGTGLTCYLTSTTFAQLTRGDLNLEDSINSGRLVVTGNSVHPREIPLLLRALGIESFSNPTHNKTVVANPEEI